MPLGLFFIPDDFTSEESDFPKAFHGVKIQQMSCATLEHMKKCFVFKSVLWQIPVNTLITERPY